MMHNDIQSILLTKQEIDGLVYKLASQINEDFQDEELLAVVILKGSMIFAADLIRCLSMNVKLDFMQASSYGESTVSSGVINIKKDLDEDVTGKNVLIIEDIIDSGNTLALIKREIQARGAKTVRIVTLLSKPSRRKIDVDVEYIGAEIPDEFVVGYGLDMAEKYRQMDYVGILKPEIYM